MSKWKKYNTERAEKAVLSANENAIRKTMDVIAEAAGQQIPLDEGTLKASLFIGFQDGTGIISFGGGPGTGQAKVPYAIRWHEETANFQRGRKAHYLRDPFNALAKSTYEKFLSQERI
jgi:hypothetical protein